MAKYGYIRVSSRDQNPERQFVALEESGVEKGNIFLDQQSGKDFERPQYRELLEKMREGDVLVVKSIDRLGRNYNEIVEQWRYISKEKKANIHVIDMPLLNTDVSHDLTGVLISDLVLQILAYVAETERAFIRQRQAEGIAVAKANGVKFGCPRIGCLERFPEVYSAWVGGEINYKQAAESLGISCTTFYRRCKEWEQNRRI